MEALGLNLVNIVIYMLLFLGVYIVVKAKLVSPLVGILDKRKQEIQESAKMNAEVTEQKSQIGKERSEILKQAKIDAKNAAQMIETNAREEAKKIVTKANQDSEAILKKANEFLAQEKLKLQEEMAEKVNIAVKKTMSEIYDMDKAEIDRALINKVIKEIS